MEQQPSGPCALTNSINKLLFQYEYKYAIIRTGDVINETIPKTENAHAHLLSTKDSPVCLIAVPPRDKKDNRK